jgi:hypothetical protein
LERFQSEKLRTTKPSTQEDVEKVAIIVRNNLFVKSGCIKKYEL